MNYDDILLPKLSGADVRVYAALRLYESMKGMSFGIYRRTITKLCRVCAKGISKSMTRLRRLKAITYDLQVEKKTDAKGRFVKGSYKTRYANIEILIDAFSVNRQDSLTQRSTVASTCLHGPSRQFDEPSPPSKHLDATVTPNGKPAKQLDETVDRRVSLTSPLSKEREAELPASASGRTGEKTVPAVEKKKESERESIFSLDEDPLLASMLSSLGKVCGREAATPLPPHTGDAARPLPPEEANKSFSKIELGKKIPADLTETITRIRQGLPLAGKNGKTTA